MGLFSKKTKNLADNSDRVLVDPREMQNPQTASDFMRRGYAFYARSMFPEAEADLLRATEFSEVRVDAYYGLGMAYKAGKQPEKAIAAFQKAVELIDAGAVEDSIRAEMLHRLAVGHINQVTEGDWNLEKEIWHRES